MLSTHLQYFFCAGGKITTHPIYGSIYLHIIIASYVPPTPAGLELNVRNIVNVLHKAGFSDGHWEQLGQQLIKYATLTTIRANRHDDSQHCMSDTIFQWLNNDLEASWEKLAEAVARVEKYGQATAECVQEEAGIVHKCMFLSEVCSYVGIVSKCIYRYVLCI